MSGTRTGMGVGVTVGALAKALGGEVRGDSAVRLYGIRQDSRRVGVGELFVARRGERVDGLQFVSQAIAQGAGAILAERGHEPGETGIPVLVVDEIKKRIGPAAAEIFGHPTKELQVVGITGTNGKTTTSYLARASIEGCGRCCGVLGTLGAFFRDFAFDAGHTTPEADEVMRLASRMLEIGASYLVMEVSSHALAQGRVEALEFAVAAYTNLTQDHLDFHGTMQAYAEAKSRLFLDFSPKRAAIMVDDAFGEELASKVKSPCLRISRHAGSRADIRPTSPAEHDARGIRAEVQTPVGRLNLDSPLVGEHNLSNLLLAMGIGISLGLPGDLLATSLSSRLVVPGRLERCDTEADDLVVLVDYAHTPDALERALQTLRPLSEGKLWCVFGCGGDRDRAKRPLMGDAAGRLSDVAILTNDNPRSEEPEAIARAVMEGLRGKASRVEVELDRAKAIEQAIVEAQAGEVVLIAGKGHEPYQIMGSETRHFDDREEARRSLAIRRAKRGERKN